MTIAEARMLSILEAFEVRIAKAEQTVVNQRATIEALREAIWELEYTVTNIGKTNELLY